ncbi:hypothetical protein ASE68_12515 [Agromyces sp. Leaf222]|nr:hypothetical protein ASE68_12515 [Agromyces sp. Leaf222]
MTVDLREAMRDDPCVSVARPSVAIWRVPLETAAGTVQTVVLILRDPTLLEELVEDRDEVFWRSGRAASDRSIVGIRSGVRLAWIDNFDHDPFERDHMLHDPLPTR